MKFITTLLLIAVAAPCACAAPIHEPIQTPTMKMVLGNPDPLLQQVRTGAIGVNDVHGGYADESVKIYPALSQTRWTPLCAAIAGDDIDSVSALLKLGASMKQPCGLFGAEKATPLEYSMRRSGVTQKAGAIARLLAAEGGVSGTGKVSEADIQNAEVQSAARLKQYKSEGDALVALLQARAVNMDAHL